MTLRAAADWTALNFDGSRDLRDRARAVIPAGVNSNVRLREQPFPLYFERSEGAYLFDVDGNRLIDYAMGNGPMLLGHRPQRVIDAVKRQLDVGLLYAGQHALEIEVAERIVELIPCAERVRFSQTGTEAVLTAIRIARAATGRQKILKFSGHFHGWSDSMFFNVHARPDEVGAGTDIPPRAESRGQQTAIGDDIIVATWNDEAPVERAFDRHGREIAAVILEPIMSNGAVDPEPGFLESLRRLTEESDTVLIFDEVITGFRYGVDGAQGLFGVVPDLAVFGKVIASGFPVSAIAGRADLFEGVEANEVSHVGTYNGYPVGMAAALATLQTLTDPSAGVYETIEARGQQLLAGLRDIGSSAGVPMLVQGRAPYSCLGFTHVERIVDHRGLTTLDADRGRTFMRLLVERGIRPYSRPAWMLSTAHTESDIDQTLAACHDVLVELSTSHDA
jgi:glutamate-1-semialdehyde 2,1-aminomutase